MNEWMDGIKIQDVERDVEFFYSLSELLCQTKSHEHRSIEHHVYAAIAVSTVSLDTCYPSRLSFKKNSFDEKNKNTLYKLRRVVDIRSFLARSPQFLVSFTASAKPCPLLCYTIQRK